MKFISNDLSQKLGRQILLVKKNSPQTLFTFGIIGVVASAVLACKSTLKLTETLDEMKSEVDGVKDHRANMDIINYSQGDYHKDLAYVYGKGTLALAKLYGPAIVLGGASLGALTGSHVTLTRRNTSLMAAYSAVQMSFDAYRERVKEALGEEKELDLRHAVSLESVDADGKIKMIKSADPNKWSPYARFFDEASPNWQKNPELNRLFVQCQQNYANHLLQARGHVFLNEVYDMLGIERSTAGQVVGWVIGDEGDNFIDFGLFEAANSRFINGWERNVLLDFNVDGVIYDKI